MKQKIGEQINAVRMPVTFAANEIMIGLAETGKAQRGFLLTNEHEYRIRRVAIWENKIRPAQESLFQLKESFMHNSDTWKLDSLELLLAEYDFLQEEIDQYFANNKRLGNSKINIDTTNAVALLYEMHTELELRRIISQRYETEVEPLLERIYLLIEPIYQGEMYSLTNDVSTVVNELNKANIRTSVIVVGAYILILIIAYFAISSLKTSISKPIALLDKLSRGELPENAASTKDELDAVIKAGNKLKKNLETASQFALSIGEGKFDVPFKPASKDDVLGGALIQMSQKLAQIDEEEQQRRWSSEGLAQFAEILRSNNNIDELSDAIISTLSMYLGANQGALFIVKEKADANPNDKILEMVSCYAYNRKKFIGKQVEVGEGFAEGLLGQAYLEKETLFLTEIPNDYAKITTGLGQSSPKSLVLVPLKINEELEGIIELASLKEFAEYQIKFVERLAESIASTIISLKTAERTKKLLELSRSQTAELRTQEEEMRQNVEELATTQEEMKKKSSELEKLLQKSQEDQDTMKKQEVEVRKMYDQVYAVKEQLQEQQSVTKGLIDGIHDQIAILNKDYVILMVNKTLREAFAKRNISIEEGKYVFDFISEDEHTYYKENYDRAMLGEDFTISTRYSNAGQNIYVDVNYFPLKDSDGRICGVCSLARNVSERRVREEEIKKINLALQNKEKELSAIIEEKDSIIQDLKEKTTGG